MNKDIRYRLKHLKKYVINEVTGEIIDSKHLKAIWDIEKSGSELKLLGYYSIVTSETIIRKPFTHFWGANSGCIIISFLLQGFCQKNLSHA